MTEFIPVEFNDKTIYYSKKEECDDDDTHLCEMTILHRNNKLCINLLDLHSNKCDKSKKTIIYDVKIYEKQGEWKVWENTYDDGKIIKNDKILDFFESVAQKLKKIHNMYFYMTLEYEHEYKSISKAREQIKLSLVKSQLGGKKKSSLTQTKKGSKKGSKKDSKKDSKKGSKNGSLKQTKNSPKMGYKRRDLRMDIRDNYDELQFVSKYITSQNQNE
jgi:hypothetical protein